MMTMVPLTATEAAFVQMVMEEHAARIRLADRQRDERMKVLLDEKGIPSGVIVSRAMQADVPILTYDDGREAPEMEAHG
jgi:hypothetical protein